MQDVCGVLLDVAEQMRRKRAERMLSILLSRSFNLSLCKTAVKKLKDCEDVLKRGAEKFRKEVGFESFVIKVEEECDTMVVFM